MSTPSRSLPLKWRLVASSVVVLVVGVATLLVFAVLHLRWKGQRDVQRYRVAALEERKAVLRNYLDIAYETLRSHEQLSQAKPYLENRYGTRLRSIVDVAVATVEHYITLAQAGLLPLDQAKRQAADAVKRMRYDGGTGYVWINDTTRPLPRMVMHPTIPALDGKILDDPKFNSVVGTKQNLFEAFLDVTDRGGQGFVYYLWPKPTRSGLTEDQPKLSYVRRVNAWGWIVGTGVYIDDAVAEARLQALETIRQMRYGRDQKGYFWVNDLGKPIPRMVMHPTLPALEGKVLDDKKFFCVLARYAPELKRGENLFTAFVRQGLRHPAGAYVDYLWPKPTASGLTEDQPKVSYVRVFTPWKLLIGTGEYIDDIEAEAAARALVVRREINGLILRLVLIALGLLVVAAMAAYWLSTAAYRRLGGEPGEIEQVAREIARGRLDVHLGDGSQLQGAFGALSEMVTNLRLMSERLRRIATGDLTQTREERHGAAAPEGTIYADLENMRSNMEKLVGGISRTSGALVGSSATLGALASQLRDLATAQVGSIQNVSSASEELDISARQVQQNIERMRGAFSLSYDAARGTKTTLDDVSKTLTTVSVQAAKVGEVIEIIERIAKQTRLIAVNASIEAANAGDAGKGFSVVAEEVSGLARTTAEATKEVETLIRSSQQYLQEAVKAFRGAGEHHQQLVSQIDASHHDANQIASSVHEQTIGTGQIRGANQELTSIASSVAASADGLISHIRELETLGKELSSAVNAFQVGRRDS